MTTVPDELVEKMRNALASPEGYARIAAEYYEPKISAVTWQAVPGIFPEAGRCVLVAQRANANPFIAFMDDCGNWYSPNGKIQHLNIMAWMSLPRVPLTQIEGDTLAKHAGRAGQ